MRTAVLDSTYAQTLFNFLFNGIDGYAVSHQARRDHNGDVSELLYGEITFETWEKIINKANPKRDGVFYDLGSGTGKAVILSHLYFDFKKAIGFELLKGLHDKAISIKNDFDKFVKPTIPNHVKDRELSFIQQDIFDVDLSVADLVFANYPFKTRELYLKLEEKMLKEMKTGAKIAFVIRAMENPRFKSLGSEKMKFGWGEATVHFYEI